MVGGGVADEPRGGESSVSVIVPRLYRELGADRETGWARGGVRGLDSKAARTEWERTHEAGRWSRLEEGLQGRAACPET